MTDPQTIVEWQLDNPDFAFIGFAVQAPGCRPDPSPTVLSNRDRLVPLYVPRECAEPWHD